MRRAGAEGRGRLTRRAIVAVAAAGAVAIAGTLLTGRPAFAIGALAAAALAFGTVAFASGKGREALASGEHARAGAVAGGLLVARLLGLSGLMVLAVAAPGVMDMWGVVAGLVTADAALLFSEAFYTSVAA